jgi:hypothetical protein
MTWKEFRLWYRQRPAQTSDIDEIFAFKKHVLVPALDGLGIDYAFILDEPDFVLVRVEVSPDAEARAKVAFEQAIQGSSPFSKLTTEDWSPEADARDRIQRALIQLQAMGAPANLSGKGWWIQGDYPTNTVVGSLQIREMPIDEKVRESASFMAKVAGEFTLAYLRSMPSRVEDRWLKSLFAHLLLDSISTPQDEEKQIRGFPYI